MSTPGPANEESPLDEDGKLKSEGIRFADREYEGSPNPGGSIPEGEQGEDEK